VLVISSMWASSASAPLNRFFNQVITVDNCAAGKGQSLLLMMSLASVAYLLPIDTYEHAGGSDFVGSPKGKQVANFTLRWVSLMDMAIRNLKGSIVERALRTSEQL
jgi:hypothetical protein